MMHTCPKCQMRYAVEENEIDFMHSCHSRSEVLDNEDVFVVGDWEDYTGSGTEQGINMQGITNNIWGQRGWIEGGKVSDKTSRGNDADTHRVRKHLQFIKFEENKNG